MRDSVSALPHNRRSQYRWLLAGCVALALATASPYSQATVLTGSLTNARYAHVAANLPDGRVLIAGGHQVGGSLSSMTASVEIYDPATGSFTPGAPLAAARGEATSVTLGDGRILVLGGLGLSTTLSSAEIYDPATGIWSAAGNMVYARRSALAVLLNDGRVLVIGGDNDKANSEVFDPATNTFSSVAVLQTPRGKPVASVLADGRVLLAGGYHASTFAYLSSAETWDPATGAWSMTGAMLAARDGATATRLVNGKVLVAGGNASNSSFPAAAEVYDPSNGTFSATGALAIPRKTHVATALPDGKVLVSGGSASNFVTESSDELYDPAAGTWRLAGWMSAPRHSHTLSVLPDGNVLIGAGGISPPLATAEIFYPGCYAMATSIAPLTQTFQVGGGNGSVALNVPANCGWSITRVPSWMTVTSGLTGMGSATISYTIAPMPGSGGRGQTLRIADHEFYVNQVSNCSSSAVATLSPASQSFTTAGGPGVIAVTYDPACAWTVAGVPGWITVTAGSGQGNGTATYSVAANTGSARSATLTIGNRNFSVSQTGVAPTCSPSAVPGISPLGQNFTSAGGSGSITVTHGAGCSWTVSGVPAWMTIVSGSSGTQNGTVSYTVQANAGAARSATLTVATKSYTLTQDAASSGGSCNPLVLNAGVTASGTLAAGDCTQGARGSSYYTDRYSVAATAGQKISLQLSASAFDTYLYLKNPAGSVLMSNDDGGGGTNSRIPASSGYYTIPAAGTYTIEVTSYGQWSTGAYSLLRTDY